MLQKNQLIPSHAEHNQENHFTMTHHKGEETVYIFLGFSLQVWSTLVLLPSIL